MYHSRERLQYYVHKAEAVCGNLYVRWCQKPWQWMFVTVNGNYRKYSHIHKILLKKHIKKPGI